MIVCAQVQQAVGAKPPRYAAGYVGTELLQYKTEDRDVLQWSSQVWDVGVWWFAV